MVSTLKLNKKITGLTSPVDMTFHGNDAYIADQIGKIYLYTNDKLQKKPILDLSKTIDRLKFGFFLRGLIPAYDERGLLGITLHPHFPKIPKIYVYYSTPTKWLKGFRFNHVGRLSEFQFLSKTKIDPKSEKVLLEINHEKASHNGGCLHFGPGGHLYLSMGDGGRYMHLLGNANAQDLSNPKGALLRMTVTPKGIVPVGEPRKGIHPLLWVWGLRNPWKFSFTPTGQCLVGDVGESDWESLYLVSGGENCGWPIKEGSHSFDDGFKLDANDPNTQLTDPVYEYGPEKGRSIIGGYQYRGSRANLRGLYIFADASKTWPHRFGFKPTGQLYALNMNNWQEVPLQVFGMPEGRLITSLSADASGDLWVLTKETFGPTGNTGIIYKIS